MVRTTGVSVGLEVPPLQKGPVTRMTLIKYACASGDFAPHHLDPEVARAQGLEDVVAHGMLSMGYLGQLVTDWAGAGNVRRLQARFATLVNVGDVLTCRGVVKSIVETVAGQRLVVLDVWAENQRGEKVTYGEAEVCLTREAQ